MPRHPNTNQVEHRLRLAWAESIIKQHMGELAATGRAEESHDCLNRLLLTGALDVKQSTEALTHVQREGLRGSEGP